MYRMRVLLVILGISFSVSTLYSQVDDVGPGRALSFDGIDDYIDVGNILDDLDVPFSVSAWVFIDPGTTGAFPILVSQDNEPIYNGFWFFISPTQVWLEMGDGLGENLPLYRRGRSASVPDLRGRWVNVAATVSASYNVSLYVNGINVGGNPAGESTLPMQSVSPLDVTKIGYFYSNGGTYRFRGMMDEVRIWSRMLSETEVRDRMCRKINSTDPGLIGCWRFDETTGATILDASSNQWSGTIKGNPTRIFSGAPIGDESVYKYSSASKSVAINGAKVVNVKPATPGVHIYKVNEPPSRTNGISGLIPDHYYGVFTASLFSGNSFDLDWGISSCAVSARNDNDVVPWTVLNSTQGIIDRKEFVFPDGTPPILELGPDVKVCNGPTFEIKSNVTEPGLSFTWSSGQISPNISVNKSGTYKLTVKNSCASVSDSLKIAFGITPPPILFSDAVKICDQSNFTIKSNINPEGLNFKWSNGATSPDIMVTASGTYTLTVSSVCGSESDSLQLEFGKTPAQFSLGNDELVCKLTSRILKPYDNDNDQFQFEWQDGSKGNSFPVTTFGTYWVTVRSSCGEATDMISFQMPETNPTDIPNVITPNGDHKNQNFVLFPLIAGPNYLTIFNRWGQEVFRDENYKDNWDGGQFPTGVYYFRLYNECVGERKGNVSIIR
jgi:hypothetical protein